MSKRDYSVLNVLIIDDQQFIRSIITTLLGQIGFKNIEQAEDGATGLSALKSFDPDLIICDIEMEPVDGLVFLETLRKSDDAKHSHIPVVFLTQHTDSHMVKKAQQLNVDAFVVKPPSYDKLYDRIEFALNAR